MRGRPHHSHADAHAHGGATLRRQSAVASLHEFVALIPFVVKRGKGQHIQEKKRGAHGYCHAQLGGVVPSLSRERRKARPLRRVQLRFRWIGGDNWVARGTAAIAFGREVSCEGVINSAEAVEMWHELEPEGYLVGPVVVPDTWLQTDMQVLLVFRAELGPDDLLKAVGLGVDEGGVLRYWQVRIPGRKKTQNLNTLSKLTIMQHLTL